MPERVQATFDSRDGGVCAAIPDYQSIMLPLLQLASDGKEWSLRDAGQAIIQKFGLTPEEVEELLPSRSQPAIYNRVGWARTYLVKAGALTQTRRGYFAIYRPWQRDSLEKAIVVEREVSIAVPRVQRLQSPSAG